MIAAVFPGQGSQHVGMCHDFYTQFDSVRFLLQEIEDTIKLNLRTIMFNGSECDLRITDHAQPALLTTSIAISNLLTQEFGITSQQWRMIAGHSLGEYTALHVSGVLSLNQTLVLIQARSQAMATVKNGGMVAVMGLSNEILKMLVQDLNQEGILCFLANDNSPQQGVLSAGVNHLPIVAERANLLGALKTVILNVSGPFHCALMRPAQDCFVPLLDIMPFCAPFCSIVTNVSGKEQSNPMVLKDHARQQMTHPVLWRNTQLTMATSGITHVVEIGAGKVLCGLAKKTIPHVQTHAINSVEAFKQWGKIMGSYVQQSHQNNRYDNSQEILSAVGS